MTRTQRMFTSVGLFVGCLAAPFVYTACHEVGTGCRIVHDASEVCIKYISADGTETMLHREDLEVAARAAGARAAASASAKTSASAGH